MYKPLALNYSFTEFGAHSELELKYYNYLEKNIGINAWGKVLGGSGGIIEIYKFLDQQLKYKTDKFVTYSNYLDIFKNRHTSLRCKDAVEFFMKLYIRLIRNVAYAQNATGGLYITNTIAEQNPELFENPEFLKELVDFNPSVSNDHTKYLKGYLAKIPVYLIKNKSTHTQLYGAALYAQKQIQKNK
jgi:glucokinase